MGKKVSQLYHSHIRIDVLIPLFFIVLIIGPKLNGQSDPYYVMKSKLDSIILDGIDSMAYPGAQVLVWVKGKEVYHKTYGYHTYENKRPVQKTDVYDMASVTKTTTGLPILMKLYGEGKFDLDAPLKQYLPEFKKSNQSKLSFRQMLSHQAGLEPYIVYWKETIKKDGTLKKNSFSFRHSDDFPIKITDRLFLHKDYKEKIWKRIRKSKVDKNPSYLYSGLLFLLLPDIITDLVGDDFESYLYENFYVPMGAYTLTYNPRKRFPKEQIIPTENDDFFRFQQVRGIVHDEAAAMLNGISCNAGLFGSSGDLAKLFQMYLNGGVYNEKRYISEDAIKEFTRVQFPEKGNRRGLGFDKPLLDYDPDLHYIAKDASPSSFGHSGFTGTFVWADPDYDMLIVFLSNRVYPTRENRKLYTMNIRPKIHQMVYNAINKTNE